ncbi:MAG: hypothetical protein KF767_18965 [Bdellovibrionaceae bacterium]|nr:hypothetical protein [Pseudobdellovibrionaceae bacterium]
MTSLTRAIFALTALALLSACSVDGQITDVTRRTYVPRLGEATGLISGSQQNLTTPEGYQVSSSVGAPFSGKTDTVTSEGYTIHSNVQGNINSETFDVIIE